MKKQYLVLFLAILAFNVKLFSQQVHGAGLRLASEEELKAIPEASTPRSGDILPLRVDLSGKMPPIGNQGNQESCTAWSVGYCLKSYEEMLEEGGSYLFAQNNANFTNSKKVFSPAFIFNQLNKGRNAGITIPDALTFLANYGAAKWSDMGYSETDYTSQPSAAAKQNALKYKIDFFRKVNVLDEIGIKAQINAGYPVVIAMTPDNNFNNGIFDKVNNVYVWKTHTGNFTPAHAIVVIGYDDNLNAFKIMNSWGTAWGNNGYLYIDYQLFKTVAFEGYIVKDKKNETTTTTTTTTTTIPPTSFLKINFGNSVFTHYINDPTYGQGMKIEGTVDIPAGYGKEFFITTYVYFQNYNAKGNPVRSSNRVFADANSNMATSTQRFNLPANGLTGYKWSVFIPYSAFDIPWGNTVNGVYKPNSNYLVYEPVLWINNFAVSFGSLVKFVMTR